MDIEVTRERPTCSKSVKQKGSSKSQIVGGDEQRRAAAQVRRQRADLDGQRTDWRRYCDG